MTFMEIYETGKKDDELTALLKENGWSIVDYFHWVNFAKAMGYIK